MCVCVCVCVSIYLCIYLCIYLSSIYLSLYPYVHLSAGFLSVGLFELSIFHTLSVYFSHFTDNSRLNPSIDSFSICLYFSEICLLQDLILLFESVYVCTLFLFLQVGIVYLCSQNLLYITQLYFPLYLTETLLLKKVHTQVYLYK